MSLSGGLHTLVVAAVIASYCGDNSLWSVQALREAGKVGLAKALAVGGGVERGLHI